MNANCRLFGDLGLKYWCLGLSVSTALACEPKTATRPPPDPRAEASPSAPAGVEPKADQRDPHKAADALARRAQEMFEVPGMAVGIVVGDELVFARGYGVKELGKPAPVDAETSFAIASNTKAFTATAVGMLVAEGKLDWDARVVEQLRDFKLWDDYVTRELRVRDLLSHRVGLDTWAGDMLWISSKLDRAEVMKRLRHLPARWGLREHYGYCNLMFMVAGVLIEQKSGEAWDVYLRKTLLAPLGMSKVATRVGQLQGRDNVATAHIKVDGAWQTTPYLDLETIGPAASFHANVEDMSRWVRMQLHDGEFEGKQVVPVEVIRETRQPHMWLHLGAEDFYSPRRNLAGYALGWYVADYRGELMVWHGGGMPGMTSRVLLFPESDVGVVVLTSSETGVSGALALQIADLYLSEAGEETKDYLAEVRTRSAEAEAAAAATPAPTLAGDPPPSLRGTWRNAVLGRGQVTTDQHGTWFEVPEHGGLRCRLYGATDPSAAKPSELPCAWEDPNMGVSTFRLEYRGKRVRSLHFQVRPDFYDPLEYAFER